MQVVIINESIFPKRFKLKKVCAPFLPVYLSWCALYMVTLYHEAASLVAIQLVSKL